MPLQAETTAAGAIRDTSLVSNELSFCFLLLRNSFLVHFFNAHFAKWQRKAKTNKTCLPYVGHCDGQQRQQAALNISLSFSTAKKTMKPKYFILWVAYYEFLPLDFHSAFQLHSWFLAGGLIPSFFSVASFAVEFYADIYIWISVVFSSSSLDHLFFVVVVHFKPAHCWRKCSFMPPFPSATHAVATAAVCRFFLTALAAKLKRNEKCLFKIVDEMLSRNRTHTQREWEPLKWEWAALSRSHFSKIHHKQLLHLLCKPLQWKIIK